MNIHNFVSIHNGYVVDKIQKQMYNISWKYIIIKESVVYYGAYNRLFRMSRF